jgi:hypothetical protein
MGVPFNTRPPIDAWLGDAYLDLGNSYRFEDLEVGPLTIQTPDDGVTQYSPLPTDLRAISQVSVDLTGQGKYVPMNPTDYTTIRRSTSVSPGRPSRYARMGYQLWYDRVPDQLYNVQITYWQKPAIVVNTNDTTSDVEATPLLMPDDWLEILDHCAALRGWTYLEDQAKIMNEKILLFGDPSDPRKGPGMIKAKMMARQAESYSSEYAIQPVVYPTCWVR